MVTKKMAVLSIILSLSFVFVSCLFAQETAPEPLAQGNVVVATEKIEAVAQAPEAAPTPEAVAQAPEAAPTPEAAKEAVAEPSAEKAAEWVWGEVVSSDNVNKQLTIKHLDYDTYEEVHTVLKIDDKTLLENVTSLDEIKQGDHVTVDYKAQGGANVAGLIVVEKKETQKTDSTADDSSVKEAAQPSAETKTTVEPAVITTVAPVAWNAETANMEIAPEPAAAQ